MGVVKVYISTPEIFRGNSKIVGKYHTFWGVHEYMDLSLVKGSYCNRSFCATFCRFFSTSTVTRELVQHSLYYPYLLNCIIIF